MDLLKLLLCCCLLVLTACNVSPEPGAARLRITQHQTQCCYVEGQISFIEVSGPSGLIQREFIADDFIQPVIDSGLVPGLYEIRSWQRPCNANCGYPEAPANECRASFTLASGHATFVTAAFAPGDEDCSLVETSAAPSSPLPDPIALRANFTTCDYAYYFGPSKTPLASPGYNCFSLANQAGNEAELKTSMQAENEDGPRYHAIIRTHKDRRIEVFRRPAEEAAPKWQHYTCTTLLGEKQWSRIELGDCREPVEL